MALRLAADAVGTPEGAQHLRKPRVMARTCMNMQELHDGAVLSRMRAGAGGAGCTTRVLARILPSVQLSDDMLSCSNMFEPLVEQSPTPT